MCKQVHLILPFWGLHQTRGTWCRCCSSEHGVAPKSRLHVCVAGLLYPAMAGERGGRRRPASAADSGTPASAFWLPHHSLTSRAFRGGAPQPYSCRVRADAPSAAALLTLHAADAMPALWTAAGLWGPRGGRVGRPHTYLTYLQRGGASGGGGRAGASAATPPARTGGCRAARPDGWAGAQSSAGVGVMGEASGAQRCAASSSQGLCRTGGRDNSGDEAIYKPCATASRSFYAVHIGICLLSTACAPCGCPRPISEHG